MSYWYLPQCHLQTPTNYSKRSYRKKAHAESDRVNEPESDCIRLWCRRILSVCMKAKPVRLNYCSRTLLVAASNFLTKYMSLCPKSLFDEHKIFRFSLAFFSFSRSSCSNSDNYHQRLNGINQAISLTQLKPRYARTCVRKGL